MYRAIQEEMKKYNEADDLQNFVSDTALTYEVKSTFSWRDFLQDKMLIMQSIRKGFPFSLFRQARQFIPLDSEEWARLLDISLKSLQRYEADGHHIFKSIHTEKIIEVAEVSILGMEVFGDKARFHLWLTSPNPIFNGLLPVDMIKDSYGKDLVIDELIRIEHGVFA